MTETVITMRNHYILCGIGRTGRQIVKEFLAAELPFVIIEQDHEAIEQVQHQCGSPIPHLTGDATEDETLEAAGIHQAAGLMSTLKDDKDNVFVVLTARSLNPSLRIVARVNDMQENAPKLRKAGADTIISPHIIGGMRMVSEMIRPEVSKFLRQMMDSSNKEQTLRFTEVRVEDITVLPTDLMSVRVSDVGRYTRLLVMAIKRAGKYIYKPSGDTLLHPSSGEQEGDILVIVATQEALDTARGRS